MKTLKHLVFVLSVCTFCLIPIFTVAIVGATTSSCKGGPNAPVNGQEGGITPNAIVGDIVVDIKGACTSISAIFPSAVATLACLSAEEAAALTQLIVSQFGLEVDAGTYRCVDLYGKPLCTTPGHLLSAIDVMNTRRAMLMDGGKNPPSDAGAFMKAVVK